MQRSGTGHGAGSAAGAAGGGEGERKGGRSGTCIEDAMDPGVSTLNLSGKNIGDEGCAHLATALQSEHCKVNTLYLGSNNIKNLGLQRLLLARLPRSRNRRNIKRLLPEWSVGSHTLPVELMDMVFAYIAETPFTIHARSNKISHVPKALAFLPHINLMLGGNPIEYPPGNIPPVSAHSWILSDFHANGAESQSSDPSSPCDSSASSLASHSPKRSKKL